MASTGPSRVAVRPQAFAGPVHRFSFRSTGQWWRSAYPPGVGQDQVQEGLVCPCGWVLTGPFQVEDDEPGRAAVVLGGGGGRLSEDQVRGSPHMVRNSSRLTNVCQRILRTNRPPRAPHPMRPACSSATPDRRGRRRSSTAPTPLIASGQPAGCRGRAAASTIASPLAATWLAGMPGAPRSQLTYSISAKSQIASTRRVAPASSGRDMSTIASPAMRITTSSIRSPR